MSENCSACGRRMNSYMSFGGRSLIFCKKCRKLYQRKEIGKTVVINWNYVTPKLTREK